MIIIDKLRIKISVYTDNIPRLELRYFTFGGVTCRRTIGGFLYKMEFNFNKKKLIR